MKHELTDTDRERAIDRLLSRVVPTGPGYGGTLCSSYTGSLSQGYAIIQIGGRKIFAHRLSWEFMRGRSIPAGEVIDHLCRNRACVNPLHLRTCTPEENSSRNAWAAQQACKRNHTLRGVNVRVRKRLRIRVRADGTPRLATATERVCRRCMKLRRSQYRGRESAKRAFLKAFHKLTELKIDASELLTTMTPLDLKKTENNA